MLLRIGELAKRAGLTVRTLHHYDDIGLLRPSARTEAGYRLYSRKDIARLHQIQALRGLGMSLADIGAVLDRPELALAPLIDRQIMAIDQLLAQQIQLRYRLSQLKARLMDGEEPELDDWLKTLELMSMYEQYFTQDELANLPFYRADGTQRAEWAELAREANALFAAGESPASKAAQALAHRWMRTLERDTNANPDWLARLDAMHTSEPTFQEQLGVDPTVVAFLLEAFAESKLAVFARYLSAEEFAFMRQHYAREMKGWPQLLIDLRNAIDAGAQPDSEQGQLLAGRWLAMLRGYAGSDPATHGKIRQAMQQEPSLAEGTWLEARTLAFLEKAVTALMGCAQPHAN